MTYTFDYISPSLKEIIEPATNKSHYFKKVLSYRSLSNSFIAPYIDWKKSIGCLLDEDGKIVQDSQCDEWSENEEYYHVQKATVEHKKVIYLGFIVTVFGHAFNDNLRKAWFFRTKQFQEYINQGAEVVYTSSWNALIPEPIIQALELAGVDIRKAKRIDQITKYDIIIVPDNCIIASPFGRMYTDEYVKTINIIKKKCRDTDEVKIDKLYFTRRKLKRSRDIGEIRIERAFHTLGYTVISPEEHPIVQQIQMLMNCTSFVSTEGSISHLTLFCRPGTHIVLINKANYLNFHQLMINEYADLNVTYVEAHHSTRASKKTPWWGPFYLFPTFYFEQFLGRHIVLLPYWLCFDYWFYCFYYSKSMRGIKSKIASIRKNKDS